MALSLQGQVAVVTGAASGIGLASATALVAQGMRVVMVDRDAAALAKACAPHGDAMLPLVVDLLDAKACAAMIPSALALAGRIDILHANAGLYIGGDLVDAEGDAIDRMLQLNVNVVMKNVRDVLPHMIARGSGDIVVTSSLAAHFPRRGSRSTRHPNGPSTASCRWCGARCSSTASASAPSRPARW